MKKDNHNYGEAKMVSINAELRQDLDNPQASIWRISKDQTEDANNILNSMNRRVYKNGVIDGVGFGLMIGTVVIYGAAVISETIKKLKIKKSKTKEEKVEINA